MAASVNNVILAGNLTRAPEVKYTTGGTAVCKLGLAVNEVYKTKDGEKKEEVLFVDCEAWGRQAENCGKYLVKGSGVIIEGSLKLDTWLDKDTGAKRSRHKVKARRVQFTGGKRQEESTQSESPYQEETSAGDDLPPF